MPTQVLIDSGDTYVAVFTSAGAETGAIKVERSALIDVTGNAPYRLRIMRAEWTVIAGESVTIAFGATTPDTALILTGTGEMCLGKKYGGIPDPISAGNTGDILFTSSGGPYTILLHIEKD